MMKRRIKEGCAVLMALALTCSVCGLSGVRAADAVDTGRSCSVEFTIGDVEDLKEARIPVSLYKVASIDAAGAYTAEAGFEGLELGAIEHGDAAAAEWLKRAEDASGMINGVTPAKETTIEQGTAEITDLSTGLYLVMARATVTPYYVYRFTPYLISLPNNYYYTGEAGDDTWVYDLTGAHAIGLKPEQTPRYGKLIISKELKNHHITMGEKATFVFEITVTTREGEVSKKQAAITFDKAETKYYTMKGIPAGATVVVEEIYSGAGYQLVGSQNPVETMITADTDTSVSFANEHDGRITGGYGVVNNFKLNENNQYDWNKTNDSADAQE